MAERATVTQVTQIGVETTPGTVTAANRRLASIDFEANPQVTVDQFRPIGSKFNSLDAFQREWMEAGLRGRPVYDELMYVLGSVLATPNPNPGTQLLDSATPTGVYKWIFEPAALSADTPWTFTVEQNSAVRNHRWAYGLIREAGLRFTRETVELTGRMIGQRLDNTNPTATGSPVSLPLDPITADDWDIFLDTTSGGLGGTKLGRVFSCNWNIGNRYGPVWIIDSSQLSFATHVELPATLNAEIVVEADSTGMALFDRLRDNATRFLRLRALGPVVYQNRSVSDAVLTAGSTTVSSATAAFVAGDVGQVIQGDGIPPGSTIVSQTGTACVISSAATITRSGATINIRAFQKSLTIDMAVKLGNITQFSDQGGVFAVGFRLDGIYDSTWGKAVHAELQNARAAS